MYTPTKESTPQSRNLNSVKASKKQNQIITPQELTPTVTELEKVLGSETILKFKTQSFHWNVEGPYFQSLHRLFEEQYEQLESHIDVIAERIRALGFYAPHSLRALTLGSYVDDAIEANLNWKFMVETLRDDHKRLGKITTDAAKLASEEGDTATASMFDDLTLFHEKSAWMLSSALKI
ncbi:MAG: DNA starvation/stationary phase protection protein [Bdellovibrionota bacterium]